MKSGADLDHYAEAAVARYTNLLTSFELLLRQALGRQDWRSERSRTALRQAAYEEANLWLTEEDDLIEKTIVDAGETAVRGVDERVGVAMEPLSQGIVDHLDALTQALQTDLRLQVERDVLSLVSALRDAALRSVLRGRGVPVRSSRSLGALRDETLSGVDFRVADRTGKRWLSTRMIRTLWRQALVYAGAESALMRMAEIGLDMAVITHPDRTHENSGRRVALIETAPGEPWSLLRQDVFHPNTHAQLAPVLEASAWQS